jgi:PAS domain S-box-containing protein
MAKHAHPSADRPEIRLEFETLIADLSSRFINVPSGEVNRGIEDTQRRVCEALGVDLSALWEGTDAVRDPLTLTHFYSSQEDLLSPMRGMSAQEYFPWLQQEMLAGRSVAVSSLEDLPEAAAFDRENLRLFGVKSNLTVPLSVGGASPFGALGFNTTRVERDWPDALVKRLQLVAQVFANALARKRADEELRESEARMSLAADSAEAGLWTLDYGTGVLWATERGRAIFGYSLDEVISMERFEASVHPEDWDLVRGAIERSAREGGPVDMEYRIIVPGDDRVRWIASRGRPESTSTGKPERLMGVSIDVTERKRAEGALRASEARLAAGAELAGLAFYEGDFVGGVMYVDDRFRDLCGIPQDLREGLQPLEFWLEHIHPDDLQRVGELRERLHDGRMSRISLEYRFLHPNSRELWIQHLAAVASRDAAGRASRTYGVLRDITARRRVENELRDLSGRLIRVHEEERALLARELHDDVTQRLAVLAIDVGRAELAAPDGAQAQAMRSVREELVRLSEDIHSLAYHLHPSVLEELGLAEALRAECERRGRQGQLGLSVEFDPLPAGVGRDAALCLFRVAQEALNNLARHAGAGAASVTLRQMDGGLLLAVGDDGVGFDPENPGERGRFGLVAMRERVRLVNGTLDIESALGQGTTIVAWVPTDGGAR